VNPVRYRCACSGSGDADRRYCSDGFLVGLVFAGWWWDLLAAGTLCETPVAIAKVNTIATATLIANDIAPISV
jgi:hypothetical protein